MGTELRFYTHLELETLACAAFALLHSVNLFIRKKNTLHENRIRASENPVGNEHPLQEQIRTDNPGTCFSRICICSPPPPPPLSFAPCPIIKREPSWTMIWLPFDALDLFLLVCYSIKIHTYRISLIWLVFTPPFFLSMQTVGISFAREIQTNECMYTCVRNFSRMFLSSLKLLAECRVFNTWLCVISLLEDWRVVRMRGGVSVSCKRSCRFVLRAQRFLLYHVG